jgi:hypothetical protein
MQAIVAPHGVRGRIGHDFTLLAVRSSKYFGSMRREVRNLFRWKRVVSNFIETFAPGFQAWVYFRFRDYRARAPQEPLLPDSDDDEPEHA